MIKAVIFDMFETLITHFHDQATIYFGTQIAEEMGILTEDFLPKWRESEPKRTLGILGIDEVAEEISKEYDCYSEEKINTVMKHRRKVVLSCFLNMHPDVLPMLAGLKEQGVKIGLISNCYLEEAEAIRDSVLAPFFDVICLSCELQMRKPNEDIYNYCVEKLQVNAEECLYIGDGGSHELDTAKKVGMTPLQAAWYLKEGTKQPVGRMEEFAPMDSPLDVLDYVGKVR